MNFLFVFVSWADVPVEFPEAQNFYHESYTLIVKGRLVDLKIFQVLSLKAPMILSIACFRKCLTSVVCVYVAISRPPPHAMQCYQTY